MCRWWYFTGLDSLIRIARVLVLNRCAMLADNIICTLPHKYTSATSFLQIYLTVFGLLHVFLCILSSCLRVLLFRMTLITRRRQQAPSVSRVAHLHVPLLTPRRAHSWNKKAPHRFVEWILEMFPLACSLHVGVCALHTDAFN